MSWKNGRWWMSPSGGGDSFHSGMRTPETSQVDSAYERIRAQQPPVKMKKPTAPKATKGKSGNRYPFSTSPTRQRVHELQACQRHSLAGASG